MNTILQKRIEEAANTTVQNLYDYAKQTRNPKVSAYSEGYLDAIDVQGDFLFKEGANYALSNQWVSVEEDLPPYEEDVVVYFINSDYNLNGNMFCHRTRRDDVSTDKNGFCIYNNEIITHWMSIPEMKGGE